MRGGGACMVGGVCGGGHAWQGGMCDTHPPGQILWPRHTVNERPVRILLECILVAFYFHCQLFTKDTSRKGLMGCRVIKRIPTRASVVGGKKNVFVSKNAKCDACNMQVFFFNLIMEKCRSSFSFSEKGNENCKIQNQ